MANININRLLVDALPNQTHVHIFEGANQSLKLTGLPCEVHLLKMRPRISRLPYRSHAPPK